MSAILASGPLSNRACGSPAHGSPTPFTSGMRRPVTNRSAETINAEAVGPRVVEASAPVPALEPVLGAGQLRQPLVDVAVDGTEFARRVSEAEIAPQPRRTGLRRSTTSSNGRLAWPGVVRTRTLARIEAMARDDGQVCRYQRPGHFGDSRMW